MSPLAQAHILAAKLLAHNLECADMNDIKAGLEMLRLHSLIAEKQEDYMGRTYEPSTGRWVGGKYVAMIWGGRDCDGVQSEGNVRYVKADLTSVMADIDREHANAEGPCWWHMVSPSEAKAIEHTSRDLTLEAFEDGHSHVLYA